MYSKTVKTINQEEKLVFSLTPIPFCLLALIVLIYYLRRGYKLGKEIKRIPSGLLINMSYRNHLKNLKLKCIISNFIILILVLELSVNFGKVLHFLPFWFRVFDKEIKSTFLNGLERDTFLFLVPLRFVLVPGLCLVMDFLWLVYRRYEYKHTLVRWVWCILIRTVVIFLTIFVYSEKLLSDDYSFVLYTVTSMSFGFLQIIDFLQYLYYTRKFYLHLKSREKEIRLFYFDHRAYLDIKYLRIHFMIATILVAISIFLFTLGGFIAILQPLTGYSIYLPIPLHWSQLINLVLQSIIDFIIEPSYMFYQLLIILNYFYIFSVVVHKFYRNRQKLIHINSYIKPIVSQYHASLYYQNYNN